MASKSKPQLFSEYYQRAKLKKQKGDLKQAKKIYLSLKQNFSPQNVDASNYVAMLADLGDIQRQLRNFNESKNIYLRGIKILDQSLKRNKHNKQSFYQIQKQKYHLYSNLGLTQISEAQTIQNKIQKYQELKKLTDLALSYYAYCQKIVVKMIIQGNQGEEKQWWWKNQFIQLTINRVNSLQIQAFQFKDKKSLSTIIQLLQKAQKFFQLCRSKTKKQLQQNISKCYYSKGICYRILQRFQQSQKYFLLDYKYCKQNNLKQDFTKTRIQLLILYYINLKFKQARQYAVKSEEKQEINQYETFYNKLKKTVLEIERKAERNQYVSQQALDDVLKSLNGEEFLLNLKVDARDFIKKLKGTRIFKQNRQIRYLLQYYSAQTAIKFQNYPQALRSIKQAINLCRQSQNKQQQIFCLILQTQILQKTQTDSKIVQKSWRQCLQQSKRSNNKQQVQQCQKGLHLYYLYKKRNQRNYNFQSQDIKQLFQHMIRLKMRRQQKIIPKQDYQQEYPMIQQFSNNQSRQIKPQTHIRKLHKPLNPLSSYLQTCKIFNIQPLQILKQLLSNQQQQMSLSKFYNFPTQQILAVIKSNIAIQQLDLRHFVITVEFIKSLKSCQNICNVKEFRINLINLNVYEKGSKKYFVQEVIEVVRKMISLEVLELSNIYQYDVLKSIVQHQSSQSFCLKSLSLKQCNLDDNNIQFLLLQQKYPQLKSLSLQNNNINGYTLDCLTYLKNLQYLNISSNPLTNLNLSQQFDKLKQIQLNYLSNNIPQEKLQKFILFILKCQKISLKFCQNVCIHILQNCINLLINNEMNLNFLKQISLFNSVIDMERTRQLVRRLRIVAPYLSKIDLRNCRVIVSQGIMMDVKEYEDLLQNDVKESGYRFGANYGMNINNPQKQFELKTVGLNSYQQNRKRKQNKFDVI